MSGGPAFGSQKGWERLLIRVAGADPFPTGGCLPLLERKEAPKAGEGCVSGGEGLGWVERCVKRGHRREEIQEFHWVLFSREAISQKRPSGVRGGGRSAKDVRVG